MPVDNSLDLMQWKRIEALRQAKAILQTAGTGRVDAFDIQTMAEYILNGEDDGKRDGASDAGLDQREDQAG